MGGEIKMALGGGTGYSEECKMKIDDWINKPLIMETKHGNIDGTIKYGIKLPIRSGMTPLQECEIGSKEKIDGTKPSYWFVNEDQSVKVGLLTKKVREDLIRGFGKDTGIFRYTIREKIK